MLLVVDMVDMGIVTELFAETSTREVVCSSSNRLDATVAISPEAYDVASSSL